MQSAKAGSNIDQERRLIDALEGEKRSLEGDINALMYVVVL